MKQTDDDDAHKVAAPSFSDLMLTPPLPHDGQFPKPAPPMVDPVPPGWNGAGTLPRPAEPVTSSPGFPGFKPTHDDDVDDDAQMIGIVTGHPMPVFPESQYVYNVPDAFERNPEMLRAEMLFYNTPLTEDYSQDVYESLKEVQEQCGADYYKYCHSQTHLQTDLDQMFDVLLGMPFDVLMANRKRRQLAAEADVKKEGSLAKDAFRYFHQFYTGEALKVPGAALLASEAVNAATVTDAAAPVLSTKKAIKKLSDRLPGVKVHGAVPEQLTAQGYRGREGPGSHGNKRFIAKSEERRSLMGFDGHAHSRTDDIAHHGPYPADPKDHHHVEGAGRPRPYGDDGIHAPSVDLPFGPFVPPSGVTIEPPHHINGDRPPEPVGKTAAHRENVPPPRGHGHPPGPDFSSDSDSDSDDDDQNDEMFRPRSKRGKHFRGPPPHHPPHELEDHSFPGALGFGAQGDMCIYQHASQLSEPCVDAIDNVYALRESYYQQSQEGAAPHGHCFFAMFFILGALLICLVRKWKTQKKRKEMRDFMEGLHKDPELKAAVESRLGMTVPAAPKDCPFHRALRTNNGNNTSGNNNNCCVKKFLYTIFFFIFALIASFFITISSLVITGQIVRGTGMEVVDPSTGEVTQQPSSFVVLSILFAACSIQVWLVATLVRKIKQWYRNTHERSNDTAPSAPAESGNSSSSSGLLPTNVMTWLGPRLQTVRSVFRRSEPHDGYVPLNGQEESTEMISIGTVYNPSHNPHSNQQAASAHQGPASVMVYTGVPTHIHTTMVPVSAMPMNNVNFV